MVHEVHLLVVIAAVIVAPATCDLPIHCLHTQIHGTWELHLGAERSTPEPVTHGYQRLQGTRCGHLLPDANAHHFATSSYKLRTSSKLKVVLAEPDIATDQNGNQGTWTSVYDEGIEIVISKMRFFAFFKYMPKNAGVNINKRETSVKDYITMCDRTLVGWYHTDEVLAKRWGCFKAVQQGAKPISSYRLSFHPGSVTKRHRGGSKQSQHPDDDSEEEDQEQEQHNEESDSGDDDEDALMQQPPAPWHSKLRHMADDDVWTPDLAFIERQNSDPQATWQATVYPEHTGLTAAEMRRRFGYASPMQRRARRGRAHKPLTLLQQAQRVGTALTAQQLRDVGLPSSFDWRNVDGLNYNSPVVNQDGWPGDCGSCYALAAIDAAEARLRILTNNTDTTRLSAQDIVSCSVYNQGCEGGYPYLGGKHAMDFGLIPADCFKYTGKEIQCKLRNASCIASHPLYVATDYGYVGGYYGATTEYEMMKEIYKHGPVMIAFSDPDNLEAYKSGVYTGKPPRHEGKTIQHPFIRRWEKSTHAITCCGWGVDKGVAYWVMKSNNGPAWGEGGYFRIRRGTDECGVESEVSFLRLQVRQR